MIEWTETQPFNTHPIGRVTTNPHPLAESRWGTVEDYRTFVLASLFSPNCGLHPERTIHETIEKAKAAIAKALGE